MDGEAKETDNEKTEKSAPDAPVSARAWAVLSYISFFCFVPLLARRDDAFVLEHARQGLLLFVTSLMLLIIGFTSGIGHVVMHIGSLFLLLFSLMGIYYALTGAHWTMPVLGKPARALKGARDA